MNEKFRKYIESIGFIKNSNMFMFTKGDYELNYSYYNYVIYYKNSEKVYGSSRIEDLNLLKKFERSIKLKKILI